MFEEDEAWEAGVRAGIALTKADVDPQALQTLAANPYRRKPEPPRRPLTPPPAVLPMELKPPWQIQFGDGGPEESEPIMVPAVLNPEWGAYHWTVDGDPRGCAIENVDWLHYARDADHAWLVGAMKELTTVRAWVKPMEDGWHIIEGGALVTFFLPYDWGHEHNLEELRAILVERKWPLR